MILAYVRSPLCSAMLERNAESVPMLQMKRWHVHIHSHIFTHRKDCTQSIEANTLFFAILYYKSRPGVIYSYFSRSVLFACMCEYVYSVLYCVTLDRNLTQKSLLYTLLGILAVIKNVSKRQNLKGSLGKRKKNLIYLNTNLTCLSFSLWIMKHGFSTALFLMLMIK